MSKEQQDPHVDDADFLCCLAEQLGEACATAHELRQHLEAIQELIPDDDDLNHINEAAARAHVCREELEAVGEQVQS